jgi:hypothetical protein
MFGFLVSLVLAAGAPWGEQGYAAPAPAVVTIDCYAQLKADLAAADRFLEDCISADPNGPMPCIDWPECCSTEAEAMRVRAVIRYLICVGVIPPPQPPSPPAGN